MQTPRFPNGAIEELLAVTTEVEVHDKLMALAQYLELDYILYGCEFSLGKQKNLTRVISNYPKSWRDRYDQEKFILVDPVMDHCRRRLVPLSWNNIPNISDRQSDFMDEAKSYGLASGISFPIHSREGDVGVLSFSSNAHDTFNHSDPQTAAALMAYGSLLATLVHDGMRRIINRPGNIMRSALTPRELECLKWIASGKSSWEISLILGISEHGVLYHVRNIMFKFDTQNRHLAVLKAIACGIV
jgi:LuxR family transcriptional regulator, quorum-sensing system regulator LasR